jgi:hypothetical protein
LHEERFGQAVAITQRLECLRVERFPSLGQRGGKRGDEIARRQLDDDEGDEGYREQQRHSPEQAAGNEQQQCHDVPSGSCSAAGGKVRGGRPRTPGRQADYQSAQYQVHGNISDGGY